MTTIGEAAAEFREDIPLKNKSSKSSGLCSCNEDCLGGSKFINASFGTLTVVITIALLVQIHYGDYQVVPHGSVATDRLECSEIGTSILKQGGNSVDAAIASTFCLAVVAPHVTGLDAGGQMLMYNHRTRNVPTFIDFDAVVTDPSIPRLILSLAYVHQQYGTFPWSNLVLPSVNLARNGFIPSKMFFQALSKTYNNLIYGPLEQGQTLRLPKLAETLERFADMEEGELYSYLTTSNQPIHDNAIRSTFYGYDVYVPGPPAIGQYLLINLQQIEKFNFTSQDYDSPEYVYTLANITQTVMRDLNLHERFHNGTSTNLAVVDLHDNYVSLVTFLRHRPCLHGVNAYVAYRNVNWGLYSYFGSGEIISGYVVDDKNRDITCSRIPIIIADNKAVCGRRIVLGGSDIALTTQVISSLLIAKHNVSESAEAPRFVMNDVSTIGIEGFHPRLLDDNILNNLERHGINYHETQQPYSSSNIVEKFKDDLTSHSDSRGGGIASRF